MFKPSLPGNEGIKIRAKRTNQSPPAHAGGIYKPSRRRKKQWIQLTLKFNECPEDVPLALHATSEVSELPNGGELAVQIPRTGKRAESPEARKSTNLP